MEEKEMEKYKGITFTEQGYNTLLNFTKSLAKEWYKKKEEDYPFRIGIVFGIPIYEYARVFKSKEELMSRIKGYGQLLGISEIEINQGNTIININLTGE